MTTLACNSCRLLIKPDELRILTDRLHLLVRARYRAEEFADAMCQATPNCVSSGRSPDGTLLYQVVQDAPGVAVMFPFGPRPHSSEAIFSFPAGKLDLALMFRPDTRRWLIPEQDWRELGLAVPLRHVLLSVWETLIHPSSQSPLAAESGSA